MSEDETGEAVVAYVSRPAPTAHSRTPSARTASVRLARFKQPTRIEVVDELPLTVTGKVQKGRLRGFERRRRPRASGVTARVTLYSRRGCHLCEVARKVVARVCADLGETYDEVDIDADPELQDRFGEEVPVTLVDGRQHDFWRVDEARLRAALARR